MEILRLTIGEKIYKKAFSLIFIIHLDKFINIRQSVPHQVFCLFRLTIVA